MSKKPPELDAAPPPPPQPPQPRQVIEKQYADGCVVLVNLENQRADLDARIAVARADLLALRKVVSLFKE